MQTDPNGHDVSSPVATGMVDHAPSNAGRLAEIVTEIRQSLRRTSLECMTIGQRLLEAKALIPHGGFERWVEESFDFTQRTAENFMNVAERFIGKTETVSYLPPTVLYSLAAPSTPPKAVSEVMERIEAGEILTPAQVNKVIEDRTDIVKRAVRAGTKVAQEIAATQGYVSLGGESVAIAAAVTEEMVETKERQTQHMVDDMERDHGLDEQTKLVGEMRILSTDPTSGDLLINAPELAQALSRGEVVTYIVYVKGSPS